MSQEAGDGWTNDRIDELKALHAKGLSAAQIAKQMGNVTRNAVLGKIHRLGMAKAVYRTPKQVNAALAPRRLPRPEDGSENNILAGKLMQVRRRVEAAKDPETPAPPPFRDPTVINGLTAIPEAERVRHFCRWPIGDPADPAFDYCGRPAREMRPGRFDSYCADHRTIVSSPKQPTGRVSNSLVGWLEKQDGRVRVKREPFRISEL
jgi:GcrA cell cycle regulator